MIVRLVYDHPVLLKSYEEDWDGYHLDNPKEDFRMTLWDFVYTTLTSYEEPDRDSKVVLSRIKEFFEDIYNDAAESAYMKNHDL
jgi:hypothetical protein